MAGFTETSRGGAAAAALSRIMLKYRPIAPKPVAGGAPAATSEKPGGSKRKRAGRMGRGGSKYSRRTRTVLRQEQEVVEKEKKKKKKNSSVEERRLRLRPSVSSSSQVVTLALMPETPERKEAGPTPGPSPSPASSGDAAAAACSFPDCRVLTSAGGRDLAPAGSWVTVESVTDTWREEEVGFGCCDETVAQGLGGDSSPCFVSDAGRGVTWTNAAYRRMVAEEEAVRVALVTRGMVPAEGTCRAFTCRVSVRYACGRRGRVTLAAPCDVWCMSDGALAWRLDLKAALSLSLAP